MSDEEGSDALRILGGLAVLGAFGIAWLWYSGSEDASTPRSTGFDAQTSAFTRREAPSGLVTPPPASDPAPASSLGMLRAKETMQTIGASAPASATPTTAAAPAAPAPARPADPATRAKDTMIRNDAQMRDFVGRMMKKYPSVAQYDKDWSSHPDLKKLQDDYWKDRDVAKFMVGVAQSENFGKMMRKYATDPGVRGFVMELVTTGPREVIGAIGELSGSDGAIKKVIGGVMGGLGIPESVSASLLGGKPENVDPNKMAAEILKSNPALQGLQQGKLPPGAQQQMNGQNPGGFPPLGQNRQ